MKKMLTFFSLLLSIGAFAAPAPLPDQGGQSINLLKNNQFSQGKTGLTASAPSTYTLVSDSSAIVGTSGKFLPTTSGQTLTSDTYTVPPGLVGAPCLLSIPYRSSESTNLINAQILDGSNAGVSPVVPFTRNMGPAAPLQLTAVCPASIKFRFTSTGSASALVIDNMLLGADNRLSQVSQAAMYGTGNFAATTGCTWQVTSSASSDPAAVASCSFPTVTGRLVASATKTPTIEAPNAPAGTYDVTFVAGHVTQRGGSNCHYLVTDESNVGPYEQQGASGGTANFYAATFHASFNYASPGGHTFKVRASSSDNTSPCVIENDGVQGGFLVRYYPSQSQTITQNSGQASSWSGYFPSTRYWTTTSGPFADPTPQGSGTLIQRDNQNFGTVSAYAGDLPGITMSPAKMGRYMACFQSKGGNSNAPTNALEIQLIDQDGTQLGTDDSYQLQSAPTHVKVCGIVNFTSLSARTLRVQMAAGGGSTSYLGFATADSLQITIFQLDAGQAAVAYPNVVASQSSSASYLQGAFLGSGGAINASSSAWISLSSHPATGVFVYAISGFSGTPYSCQVNAYDNGANAGAFFTNMTQTSLEIHTSLNGSAADLPHNVTCFGPK